MNFDEFNIATQARNFTLTHGGNGKKFYVGITNNIQRRLFDEHQVKEESDLYSFWNAQSHESADKIEKYLLNKYPYEGHAGLGKDNSKYVYVYRIEDHTKQKTNEGNYFVDLDGDSELITG